MPVSFSKNLNKSQLGQISQFLHNTHFIELKYTFLMQQKQIYIYYAITFQKQSHIPKSVPPPFICYNTRSFFLPQIIKCISVLPQLCTPSSTFYLYNVQHHPLPNTFLLYNTILYLTYLYCKEAFSPLPPYCRRPSPLPPILAGYLVCCSKVLYMWGGGRGTYMPKEKKQK